MKYVLNKQACIFYLDFYLPLFACWLFKCIPAIRGFDHSFSSPTYEDPIRKEIYKYFDMVGH